jgi:hypothetical protein
MVYLQALCVFENAGRDFLLFDCRYALCRQRHSCCAESRSNQFLAITFAVPVLEWRSNWWHWPVQCHALARSGIGQGMIYNYQLNTVR